MAKGKYARKRFARNNPGFTFAPAKKTSRRGLVHVPPVVDTPVDRTFTVRSDFRGTSFADVNGKPVAITMLKRA